MVFPGGIEKTSSMKWVKLAIAVDFQYQDEFSCTVSFFLSTIWLLHGQLWDIIEGTASLHFESFDSNVSGSQYLTF